MKIGIHVTPQYPPEEDLTKALPALLEQVRAARDAGAESLWLPHHFATHPMRMYDTHLLLARLAPEARGMAIGPGVLLLPMLNPVLVAEEAATLDHFAAETGGHYVLAVGLGYRPEEFKIVGVPREERAGRLSEAVGLIRRLWTEERVSHQGRYYSVDDVGLSMRPARPGGCPVWIGGSVAPAVERAARLGDTWIASFSQTRGELVDLRRAYDGARVAAGLPAPDELALCRECYIGADDATAFDECREALLYKYEAYASWGNANVGASGFRERFDEFVRDRFLIGDAERVADEIRRYREDVGATHLILRMSWPKLEPEKTIASLKRLEAIKARL